jgi:hypothetical protein
MVIGTVGPLMVAVVFVVVLLAAIVVRVFTRWGERRPDTPSQGRDRHDERQAP